MTVTNSRTPANTDRAYAEDMGFSICPQCGTTYIPQGLPNEGHSCPSGRTEHNIP